MVDLSAVDLYELATALGDQGSTRFAPLLSRPRYRGQGRTENSEAQRALLASGGRLRSSPGQGRAYRIGAEPKVEVRRGCGHALKVLMERTGARPC